MLCALRWINENGSFDFKLDNTSNDWSDMFKYCKLLTHLPENFNLSNSVTDCSLMFKECKSLTHLPDNFTIPNNTTSCHRMFSDCKSLTHLPNNFHIPENAYCTGIFHECDKLENKDPEFYRMIEL